MSNHTISIPRDVVTTVDLDDFRFYREYSCGRACQTFAGAAQYGWARGVVSHDREVVAIPVAIEDAQVAIPWLCTDNNWSLANALYTIVAVMLAYYSQPPGSIVFRSAGRVWRLSPVFALWETLHILWMLLVGCYWYGYPLAVTSHTILAIRCGNKPKTSEIEKAFIAEGRTERGRNELTSIPQATSPRRPATAWMRFGDRSEYNYYDIPLEYQEFDSEEAPTAPMLRSDATGDSDIPTQTQLVFGGRSRPIFPEEEGDRIFHIFLGTVSGYECGPSFRALTWMVSILQAVKLVVVTGAIHARLIAAIYFLAWFTIESMSILATTGHLSTPRHVSQSLMLSQQWRRSFYYNDFGELQDESSEITSFSSSSALLYNMGIVFFFSILYAWHVIGAGVFDIFRFFEELGSPWYNICVLFIASIAPILFFCGMYLMANCIALLYDIRKTKAHFVTRTWLQWFESGREDILLVWPTAVITGFIVVFSFSIDWPGLQLEFTFDCTDTAKPSYYDWLG